MQENLGFWKSIWRYGWKPTTTDLLRDTETAILRTGLKTNYEHFYVDIGGGHHINTIKLGSGPPLVMLHGFGGGVGIWVGNLDLIARHFTIYAMDILGFARSSRPAFSGNSPEASEEWFIAMKLGPFNLLGHSFGGYLASIYTLKYPHIILRLILADPWGVPERPENLPPPSSLRGQAIHLAANVVTSPFSVLRALGPVGPSLIDKFRPDLTLKFADIFPDTKLMSSYIYHCNAQSPSGESAFWHLQIPFGWAKLPLACRLDLIPQNIPITAIYGEDTWMDYRSLVNILPNLGSRTEIVLLPDAGHHVYIDSATLFNFAVVATKDDSVSNYIRRNKLVGWCNYETQQ